MGFHHRKCQGLFLYYHDTSKYVLGVEDPFQMSLDKKHTDKFFFVTNCVQIACLCLQIVFLHQNSEEFDLGLQQWKL